VALTTFTMLCNHHHDPSNSFSPETSLSLFIHFTTTPHSLGRCFVLFLFLWYWGLNSVSHFAGQVVYHLSHTTSPHQEFLNNISKKLDLMNTWRTLGNTRSSNDQVTTKIRKVSDLFKVFFFFFFFFWWLGFERRFMLAKQESYCSKHTSSPFCSGYL
jgi:hypothetical protein